MKSKISAGTWFIRAGRDALSALAALFIGAPAGYSSTNTVTSLADSGSGSLRQVIADSAPGDAIVFNVGGTIALSSGELMLAKHLAIFGPGSSALAISGGGASRVFNIKSNVNALISSLTICNGRARDGTNSTSYADGEPGQPGGAILTAGLLTLWNCLVCSNQAGNGGDGFCVDPMHHQCSLGGAGGAGGAIYNSGALSLSNCVIAYNATGQGGETLGRFASAGGGAGAGIWNGGNCVADRCTFSSNTTGAGADGPYSELQSGTGGNGGSGGGLFNAGTMALTNCTVSNNLCGAGGKGGQGRYPSSAGSGGLGGGVCTSNSLVLVGCTVVSNRAGLGGTGANNDSGFPAGGGGYGGDGGGIYGAGSLILTNCTLAGNRGGNGGAGGSQQGIPGPSGIAGSGGGMNLAWGNLGVNTQSVVACTVLNNAAGSNGVAGGVATTGGTYVFLLNNIVALNTGQAPDVSGWFTSLGHNLVGITNGSGGFTAPGDLVGSIASPLDPKIAPLADNGGPTLTMALLPGSPAIDAGTAFGTPATDERGVVRPQGAGVDIGAYEFQFTVPQITGARFLSSSNFWLQSCGLSNQCYNLQVSTNLVSWSDLTNLTAGVNGVCEFVDCSAAQSGTRFYRLKVLRP